MKTILASLLALALTITAQAQIDLVDTNTVHSVGGTLITGDPLPVAFTKIDLSLTWLNNFCLTNQSSNSYLFAVVGTLKTNLATVSNMVVTAQASLSSFPGTNIQNGTVNSNKLDAATMAWLNSIGWIQVLNGTNIQSGTVNSNAFDYYTTLWLQSCMVPGVAMNFDSGTITSDGSGNLTVATLFGGLKDASYSTGASGYVPIANGGGGYVWTAWPASDVVADTGGFGGTCLHLKASDNGADMYLHVTSGGTVTATGSP